MEEDPSRSCPRCGTPRVGNFRWCRTCQFDFDADRVSGASPAAPPTPPAPDEPTMVPAFRLTPPMASPGPSPRPSWAETPPVAPDPTPAAPSATDAPPAPRAARFRISRRIGLPLAAAGIVGVIVVVTLILIQQRSSSPDSVASAGPSAGVAGASSAPTTAPTRVAAPSPFGPIQLSGTGSGDVAFSIPDGASGLATITNEGTGPFVVWSVAADGTRNDQLVNEVGNFAGTRLFDENRHSTTFAVESDGAWSIEVKPISAARTWNGSDRLVGDGPDVIRVVPPTSADLTTAVRYDGTSNFAVAVYATSGKQKLLNVVGPFTGPLPLPVGSALIEIEAGDAWSLDPG